MADYVMHTEVFNGRKITIWRDDDPMSPADWDGTDEVALLVTHHPRYKFSGHTEDKVPEGWVALDVFMYDHSGVTISINPFGCRWDSGPIGHVWYDPNYSVTHDGGVTTGKDIAEAIVKEWDQFLTGDVYGYTIEPEGEDPLGLIYEESVGGFYGDWTECLEQARACADTDTVPHKSYPTLVKDGPWL